MCGELADGLHHTPDGTAYVRILRTVTDDDGAAESSWVAGRLRRRLLRAAGLFSAERSIPPRRHPVEPGVDVYESNWGKDDRERRRHPLAETDLVVRQTDRLDFDASGSAQLGNDETKVGVRSFGSPVLQPNLDIASHPAKQQVRPPNLRKGAPYVPVEADLAVDLPRIHATLDEDGGSFDQQRGRYGCIDGSGEEFVADVRESPRSDRFARGGHSA